MEKELDLLSHGSERSETPRAQKLLGWKEVHNAPVHELRFSMGYTHKEVQRT